jgi:hypothetical protein
MEKTPQKGLNIHFVDGSTIKISFPEQAANQYGRKLKVDEILKKRMLMVEADGGVHFIPLENVKYLSVFPAADYADPGLIKGAHFSH